MTAAEGQRGRMREREREREREIEENQLVQSEQLWASAPTMLTMQHAPDCLQWTPLTLLRVRSSPGQEGDCVSLVWWSLPLRPCGCIPPTPHCFSLPGCDQDWNLMNMVGELRISYGHCLIITSSSPKSYYPHTCLHCGR